MLLLMFATIERKIIAITIMNTYLIGDVQGCFDSLQLLLKKIQFNPEKDRLGFAGDLVNRGPKSLEVLRFISQLKNPMVVLGNHDLHLLALYFLKEFKHKNNDHTLNAILNAPDCDALIDFLLQQPLLFVEGELAMVHAGIPPQWSIDAAILHAATVQNKLQENPTAFFENIYGNAPSAWDDALTGWDRIRYCVNAFTRMRFCTRQGELDLCNKTNISLLPNFQPWFDWSKLPGDVYFGHWASLAGRCNKPHIFALDTGCVWGGPLTAIRVEDKKIFCVSSAE